MGCTTRPWSSHHRWMSVVRQIRPTLNSAIGAGKPGCFVSCQVRFAPTPSSWAISAIATTSGPICAGSTETPYRPHEHLLSNSRLLNELISKLLPYSGRPGRPGRRESS
jgi:hypothetical protein